MSEPTVPQEGAFTFDELFAVWVSSVDSYFAQSLVDKGDGKGIEAYGQMVAQLVRVSRAIDVSTQAMYILPYSGQTSDPAAGEAKATVTLTLARSGRLDLPLVVGTTVAFEEVTTDWGDDPGSEGVAVATGRRYRLLAPAVFPAGFGGPIGAAAAAEAPGWGYNNPLPGTITGVDQVGEGFLNDGATVFSTPTSPVRVAADVEADTFVPQHVDQYIASTAGANLGKVARVVTYVRPGPGDSGSVVLEREVAFDATFAGALLFGEAVTQAGSGATATFLGASATSAVVSVRLGTPSATGVWTGSTSGATFTPSAVSSDSTYAPEAATLAWRVYSWVDDWGLTATNAASPAGGRLGFLDELGRERNLPRSASEGDDAYRQRISQIADVVSPNAVSRAVSRVATPLGLEGCLREAGTAKLPGFFGDVDHYDQGEWAVVTPPLSPTYYASERVLQFNAGTGTYATGRAVVRSALVLGVILSLFDGAVPDPGSPAFVAGYPIVGQASGSTYTPPVAPVGGPLVADRYRYLFSFEEMRGWFLVALPRVGLGDFGFALDVGGPDQSPYPDFYDGYPVGQDAFYASVWASVEAVRAGGVGWDIVQDDGSCT